jgi:hypothetical protein
MGDSDSWVSPDNRNPVENNMRRNQRQQQKQKPNEGKNKNTP